MKALGEEKAQLKAGGPITIPDLVDLRSKTVMKNEYQHDERRHDGGPVPAQHVLCPSRAPGSPYVQSSVYMVPVRSYCSVSLWSRLPLANQERRHCREATMEVGSRPAQWHTTNVSRPPSRRFVSAQRCVAVRSDGEHLFIYSGPQTKHYAQSDSVTGLPTLMPYSAAVDERFPWRWGGHNMAPGTWQRVDMTTILMSGSRNEMVRPCLLD